MTTLNFSEQIYSHSINIDIEQLKGDVNKRILHVLKEKYEGKCNNVGFIEKDSIEILNRSIGEIKTIDSKSYICYNVTYKTRILLPSEGETLKSTIKSITKMGIIAYATMDGKYEMTNSPYIIIVPKESFTDEDKINSLTVGDELDIIISAFRVKHLSDNIQVVGQPVV